MVLRSRFECEGSQAESVCGSPAEDPMMMHNGTDLEIVTHGVAALETRMTLGAGVLASSE
jgi:hypothetical protein